MYRSQRFVVRVTGRLLRADTHLPLPRAWVMPLPTAAWTDEARSLRDLREASQMNVLVRGGGTTSREGAFELLGATIWRDDVAGASVAGHGVGALLIEVDGYESQIVAVPNPPSAPSLDEYELLATYDLGRIEVAMTATRAAMLVA